MGLQTIEAAPKDRNPVFLVDQDTGDMTTAHCAVIVQCFLAFRLKGRARRLLFPQPNGYRGPKCSRAHAEQAESLHVQLLL